MEFYALALLPLALASLFHKRKDSDALIFGLALAPFLKMVAPVVAKGVSSLIGSKQKSNAAKTAEAQRKKEVEAADAKAKLDWEGQQNSPAAQAARFKNTLQLGRLSGSMGGLDKLPPSIKNYYQTQRTMPTYTGQSSYIEPVKAKGGGWNFLGGVADALSYLDTSKMGGGGVSKSLMGAGNAAAAQGGLGALQGGGPATILSDLTKRVSKQPQAPIRLSSGQTINPFDPKLGNG